MTDMNLLLLKTFFTGFVFLLTNYSSFSRTELLAINLAVIFRDDGFVKKKEDNYFLQKSSEN